MRNRLTASLSKFPLLAGITVFVLMMLVLYFIVQQRYQIFKGIEKRELKIAAGEVKSRMEAVFRQASVATSTAKLIVEKYGFEQDFDEVARRILENNKAIDLIVLEKTGEKPKFFPLNGNEEMGLHKRFSEPGTNSIHSNPAGNKELYFEGPFELERGESSIIGRQPIFINNKFWGYSTVVFHYQTLLGQAGLDSSNGSYTFQVSRINDTGKEEYLLPSPLPTQKRYPVSDYIPESKWKIYADFSKRSPILSRPPIVILGFLLSVVAGLFTYYLVRRPVELKKLVDEKTRDLIERDKQFNRALHEAQENERLQISMELHDHIKQIMAASMITLDHVRANSNQQKIVNECVDRVKSYLREANEDIRKISHRLAPSVDTLDLEEKIKLLAATMNVNKNMKIEFNMIKETESISNNVQLALYRILQEQLTNIIKYAEASSVAINMEKKENELVMYVRDNGKGFDLLQKKTGIGLENMRRRAHTLNGNMKISSSPGKGCILEVRFPLN